MEDKAHKAHHAAQSGAKAEKKAKSKGKGKADHGKGYNEKVGFPFDKFVQLVKSNYHIGICSQVGPKSG
jgi:hypothetical protein